MTLTATGTAPRYQNRDMSQVWSVPPALHKSNLSSELAGEVIALSGVHAKGRRDGYRIGGR